MKKILIKNKNTLYVCAISIVLGACNMTPPKSTPASPTVVLDDLDKSIAASKAPPKPLTTLPDSVQNELREQSLYQAREGLLAEKRLEIAAKGANAKDFFAAVIEDSPYSIAVHPEVTGSITLNLKDVTLDETLSVVEEIYGYEIRRQGRVIQVYPAGIRTETIPLNYLFVKRTGVSNTSINSGGVSENDPDSDNNSNSNNSSNSNSSSGSNSSNEDSNTNGVNISTANESDFWTELKDTLQVLVGTEKGRTVIVSPQAGLVTVRALPGEIESVRKFIEQTEEHLRRQVIIEAKIMEVTLNDDYQQGVKWDKIIGDLGDTDLSFSTEGNILGNTISSAIGGTSTFSFINKDFSGVIELLATQGNVQVLSSPRITATNNQKAVIKVGEDEYFVTDISNTTTTGTATTSTPEIDLTPFFSGIALDVTPQIDNNGEVILHVHPSVTETDEQMKTILINDDQIVLPLAQSNVRESDTIIRAKSNEIVIIGGLIETRIVDIESKTPLLGDIPFLGELFTSKSQSTKKKELIIMLKPIVINQDTWQNQLQDARTLLKKWFPDEEQLDSSSNEDSQ